VAHYVIRKSGQVLNLDKNEKLFTIEALKCVSVARFAN